ncbi:MAG: MBL fold metallo-hydrolase [Puniceicoccales bacterium]|jgi:glyoxylase-like metal-dependent hydrolase (beta-lactamase superfamily II)|nr:MBL fold metallo-hydrolase [Puniceicoccales bacterium]
MAETLPKLTCERFPCGPIRTNMYLVLNSLRQSVLIDAAPGSFDAYAKFSQSNSNHLSAVLLTHGHWDHFSDAARFQAEGVAIYVSVTDGAWIRRPEYVRDFVPGELDAKPCAANFYLNHGDSLNFIGVKWQVLAIGGHTPGGLAYYLPSMQWVFTGDSLFAGTIGRTDLPGGNHAQLIGEIQDRLLQLPPETQIFPGHGGSSTIGYEINENPFTQTKF